MKITFNSPVILGFSFLCVVIYVLTHYFGMGMGMFTLPATFNFGAFASYFKLISYVFGHADADHLIGNLSFILLLGPIIEEKYGARHTLLLLFITAVITAILHIILFSNGLMGASGIVFALIILSSLVNFKNKEIPITFILVAIIFVGKEIIALFDTDHISQFAHIIGGCIGAYFGFTFRRKSNTTNGGAAPTILKGLKNK